MNKTKSVAMLGGLLILVVIILNIISHPYTISEITPLNKDRIYYTDKSPILTKLENETMIKDIATNQRVYFQYDLPEFTDDYYIMVKSNHQNITVRLGDKEIFSQITPNDKNPGISWYFVNLDTSAYSQKLTIILSSPYKSYTGKIPELYMGSPISLYSYALSNSFFDIAIFMLCMVTAILGVVTHLIWNKSQKGTMTLSFSVFLMIMGLYLVSTQSIMSLLFSPVQISSAILTITYIIPTITLYMMSRYFIKYRFIVMINFLVLSVFNVITIFGSWFNVVQLPAIMPSFTILFLVTIFIVFGATIAELFRGNKRPCIVGGISLLLIIAVIFRMSHNIISKYLLICFAIMACLYYMSQLLGNIFSLQRLKRSNQKLQNIAFVDTFTGLRNRNAFEQFMLIMNDEDLASQKVSVVVFDLNNLKRVNDTLGHKAGDDYILRCTGNISKYFCNDEEEVFRIGGDEFVVICAGLSLSTIKDRLVKMDEEFKQLSMGLDYPVGVAHGVAMFDKKRDNTLNDTMRRADKEMYANKLHMKNEVLL